jgi:hypothetical protein
MALQHSITKHKGGSKNRVETRTCYRCHQEDLGRVDFSGAQWKAGKDDGQVRRCFCCQRAEGVRSSVLSQDDAVREAVAAERARASAEWFATTVCLAAVQEEQSPEPMHVRRATTKVDDGFPARYNMAYLDTNQESWSEETGTLSFKLDAAQRLLLEPFLAVADLSRDSDGYVLLSNGRTHFKTGRKWLAGFAKYSSVQSNAPAEQRDREQIRHIISFLPWSIWKAKWPEELLASQPATTSADWAMAFEQMLLAKMKAKFREGKIYWNPDFTILYVHVLDQSCPSARFVWHMDTEEDTLKQRVYYSCVILLRKDGTVAGMQIAGAPEVAHYSGPGSGHIFNAALFHTTEKKEGCGGLKLGVFVGLNI